VKQRVNRLMVDLLFTMDVTLFIINYYFKIILNLLYLPRDYSWKLAIVATIWPKTYSLV